MGGSKEWNKEYYRKNKEKIIARNKAWALANPDKVKEYKERNKPTPSQNKQYNLKYTYNITLDDYDNLLESQGGGCAICGGINDDGTRLYVDHDHSCCPGNRSCGKCIRGLLCRDCNTGLGAFRDDCDRLSAAIDYLEYFRKNWRTT